MHTRPATKNSIDVPSASVSASRAPSIIGSRSPGSQIQMTRPIAVSSETAVRKGTATVCTKRPRSNPTNSTTIEPPTVAISGESSL
jgi:hypothetical protein